MLAILAGCSRTQLDAGSYSSELSGTLERFGGDAAESFTSTVRMDWTLVDGTGLRQFEVFVCDGLTEFRSSVPCFSSVLVQHSSSGLVGFKESTWGQVENVSDTGLEPLGCSGAESLGINGAVVDGSHAELEISYHLTLTSTETEECVNEVDTLPFRIVASGAMTLD